jgi:DNA invertase Pin-like site-specific DNA recombinase
MTAAIYARKSTEQAGIADEQKSVARQIEHACQYAARKGWTVDEASVFVDDGISGAEFSARPGFVRLMNALKPRPAFQVLIMSEVARLGREQIETAYALKQLSVAGVRCFSYLEDRELLIESATDKFLLGAVTFAADLEREKARQRTYDAMVRKARAGHVTGAACSGTTTSTSRRPGGSGRTSYGASTRLRRRSFDAFTSGARMVPASALSRKNSTRRALRHRRRSRDGPSRGRRRRSGKRCGGQSTEGRSRGTSPASATNGARNISSRATRPSGSRSTRRTCGSFLRGSGSGRTLGSQGRGMRI